MKDINLGALTTSVQKASSISQINSTPSDSSVSIVVENNGNGKEVPNYGTTRIQLTDENKNRIDLLRLSSDKIEFVSRTQLVNKIIELYFEEHSQNISTNINNLLNNL